MPQDSAPPPVLAAPSADADAALPPAVDLVRKESSKRKEPPPPTGTRFKAAANMVMAMRRFQGVCAREIERAWRGGRARRR